jgi:hypothetical protein
MNIRIYTNAEGNEYAIAREGDQVMQATTQQGILYPVLEGEYEITATSDLAFISEEIQEALELHAQHINNCNEDGIEFECCNCLATIEKSESHGEIVLYAGDTEIGMMAAYHNDCSEAAPRTAERSGYARS